MEKMNEIKRSELWYKIHSIVSQIPKREVDGDCMDYPSASTQIEKLLATEDKKAPVLAEEIFNTIPFLDIKGDHYNMPKSSVIMAMTEFGSQERNRAIQECIDKLDEKLVAADLEFIDGLDYAIEILRKLKKSS